VILGADYKHFGESLTLTGGSGAVQTPVTYYPFSLSYNGTRVDGAGNTQWSLGTLFALRGLYTNEGYFSNKRFGGQSNFSILRWDLQRTQSLPLEMSLFARVDGQVSSGPLIVNEQFLAGGATTVRGYLEAEALGDNGVHGSLELRSPALGALPDGMDLRLHAFTEGSHLTITDALPRQQNKFTLSSLGFGLRLNVRGLWTLGGNLAWPIHATSYTKAWSPRLLFTTALQF
jgi:hemolysin activation/secretion protein